MSRSEPFPEAAGPSAEFSHLLHLLAGSMAGIALGLGLGVVVARAIRARGLHWSWLVVATAAALWLHSALGSLLPVGLAVSLSALLRSRRWHREDLDAGADLARAAKLRKGPADVLLALINAAALRRRRAVGSRGWFRAGELIVGRARLGRLVSIPLGGARGGTHALLVGATGSGKTVTQTWIATRAIERGMGAIVIDPKGDHAMREAVDRAAQRVGRELIEWTPEGPCAYNPFARGSDTEVADKVLAGERFTEPHYLRQAQRFLGHVIRALRASGVETSLPAIAANLDPRALELLARSLPESGAKVVHGYLDSLTARQLSDVAGVRDRLSILAESDVARWLEPHGGATRPFDLFEAVRERAIVYFDLEADRRPLLTQMLGAAIVQDLQTTVALVRTHAHPTIVVIDEFSALAAEQVVRLFGRARSAGFSLVLSTQELADLRLPGREAVLEQVLGNLAVLLAHRQVVPASAELVCKLAGSKAVWRTSRQDGGRTSRSRAREGLLSVEDVMGLAPGRVAAITFGGEASTQLARVFSEREERV
jgi:type IV secretory pathway TraG/TraD family ATPase VirD4